MKKRTCRTIAAGLSAVMVMGMLGGCKVAVSEEHGGTDSGTGSVSGTTEKYGKS